MEIEEKRLIELRQSRASCERNRLQVAMAQVQRQHNTTTKQLVETQSKFRKIFEDLKSKEQAHKVDQRTKLDTARFKAATIKRVNVKLGALNNEVSTLGQRHKALSQHAAKLEKINNRCQERIQLIKHKLQNQRELSFEEEFVEAETARKRSDNDARQTYGTESSQPAATATTLNVQADGRNSNNQGHNEFVQPKEAPQPRAAHNPSSPFENIERIEAWRTGQLASVVLTYRLTSGRAINIEASQITGSKIQISLAPEFQQDREKLLRERGRMVAALREAGVKVEGVVIL